MNRRNVLIVTRRQASSASLHEWALIAHPFHVRVVESDEEAIECCHLQQFDVVLVDETDEDIDSKKLHAVLPILQEKVILLRYDGEPAQKLSENVEAVFNAIKYRRILNMIMPEPGDSQTPLPQFSLN